MSSGYLALRNDTAYDASNEIGKLYTGDTVELCDMTTSAYWFVYSSKLDKYGYVNKDYLTAVSSTPIVSSGDYTVSVSSGYLALRNAKAFDASNEIGKLYSGDTVQVQDTSDSTYWYVYSPKLGAYGYVNKNYLLRLKCSDPYGLHLDRKRQQRLSGSSQCKGLRCLQRDRPALQRRYRRGQRFQ